jgi:hypothetical protein
MGFRFLGAIISTVLAARWRPLFFKKWLRRKGVTQERSQAMAMANRMALVDRIVVNVAQTFSGPGYFHGCEPKMVRKDKADPNSEQVQGKDASGALKWTALVLLKQRTFDKEVPVTLSITLKSATHPCAQLHEGQPVVIEGLEQGLMVQNGHVTQFWSATSLKPVQVTAQAPASSR